MREILKPIVCFIGVFFALAAICIIQKALTYDWENEEKAEEPVAITFSVDYYNSEKFSEDDSKLIYADTKEEAIAVAECFESYPYMKRVDTIIWEDENEEYAAMYYQTIKRWRWEGTAMCKFKIRNTDGKKQYALLKIDIMEARTNWLRSDPLETVQVLVYAFDMMSQYSIEDGKRFIWGSLGTEKVKTLKIEGQSPTGVIEYTALGEKEYFWYYDDVESDKPGVQFTVEMETED
jgi:hypothetical protein